MVGCLPPSTLVYSPKLDLVRRSLLGQLMLPLVLESPTKFAIDLTSGAQMNYVQILRDFKLATRILKY